MGDKKKLTCENCKKTFDKDSLQRDCGNCFACTGCEIYICPDCRHEIVVKPMKKVAGKK